MVSNWSEEEFGGDEETAAAGNVGFVGSLVKEPQTLHKSYFSPQQYNKLLSVPHLMPNDPYSLVLCESDPELSNFPISTPIVCKNRFQPLENTGIACQVSSEYEKNDRWIFDFGATDTITYDASDLTGIQKPQKSHIQTANGEFTKVEGAGTVKISHTLQLSNCLYIPSMSHKLLSISHVTKELNCTLLMQPHFCLLQDIRTGEIIGRGTERDGLYYVDEIAQKGTAMLTHGSANRKAWLWHRRLGHPSIGYLKLLFPDFVSKHDEYCETCFFGQRPPNLLSFE